MTADTEELVTQTTLFSASSRDAYPGALRFTVEVVDPESSRGRVVGYARGVIFSEELLPEEKIDAADSISGDAEEALRGFTHWFDSVDFDEGSIAYLERIEFQGGYSERELLALVIEELAGEPLRPGYITVIPETSGLSTDFSGMGFHTTGNGRAIAVDSGALASELGVFDHTFA